MSGRRSLPGRIADRIALRRGALHERRLAEDHLRRAGRPELDAWFVERHGSSVLHGPLAGLSYPPAVLADVHHLTAKLLGAYEEELSAVIAAEVERRPPLFVDIGSADGYYAAGFALASPGTVVHAFEIDPVARGVLDRLVRTNGLAARVFMHGPANARRLAEHDLAGAFVLCDIEGAELDVLAGEAVPALAHATLLVEVHPLAGGADTAPALRERFGPTHRIEAIEPRERDPAAQPELDGAPHRDSALDEYRFGRTSWLAMHPRTLPH
ncbi:MAG TPA: hypothetical protein VF517_08060 [Thermoleophilaceae bacterium]